MKALTTEEFKENFYKKYGKFYILDKVNYDGTDYYYIAKINETETDIENNYKLIIVKDDMYIIFCLIVAWTLSIFKNKLINKKFSIGKQKIAIRAINISF